MKKILMLVCLVLLSTSCSTMTTYDQNNGVLEKTYYSPLYQYEWRKKEQMYHNTSVDQVYYLPKNYRVIKE